MTIVVWTLPLAPGWYEQIVEWKIEHCRGGDEHSALGRLVGVVEQLVASLHIQKKEGVVKIADNLLSS